MSQREILTNGNAFKRTDGRWGGTVWYLDEKGERKRKENEKIYLGIQSAEERFC